MKAKLVCCFLLVTLFFSLSAFALSGKGKISLRTPTQLAGKQLAAGDYKITWTGDANAVQVTFASADNKTVITAPAKVVEAEKARTNAIIKSPDGSVKQIWFGGKTAALVF